MHDDGDENIAANLQLKRIDSFWAKALHKDVFPVPGGPCKRMILKESTSAS